MQQWHELETLKGYTLQARDGDIGKITDVWFDDDGWTVRYLVVRTGGWLLGREVLLAPSVVRGLNPAREQIAVELTRQQVEKSPPIDSAQTVSRHYESQLHDHYGWAPYWMGGGFGALGPMGSTGAPPPAPRTAVQQPADPHLRSSNEVRGYNMQALDGEIGEIADFVVHADDWCIRYLVADTGKWLPGRKVLMAPSWVEAILWSARAINIDIERATLRSAPEYAGPQSIDKRYEVALYRHYGVALPHMQTEEST